MNPIAPTLTRVPYAVQSGLDPFYPFPGTSVRGFRQTRSADLPGRDVIDAGSQFGRVVVQGGIHPASRVGMQSLTGEMKK